MWKCAICVAKEQGVVVPEGKTIEDYVLTQYIMPDPTKPPVPIDAEDPLANGVLLLMSEEDKAMADRIPMVGGIMGKVGAMFRAFGFKSKPQVETGSQQIVKTRPRNNLYGPSRAKGDK